MTTNAYIGTSGWNYDAWKDGFFEGVPKSKWLEHCAEQFNSLEVNGTFYRLQSEKTLKSWVERTPDDFVFAAKGHRYLTHNKKLKDPDEPIVRSRDNNRPLEKKLAVKLWQLPADLKKNVERLEGFARALSNRWSSVRHAMEFRHTSWFDDEVAEVLSDYDLANCQSDAADWPMWEAVTTDLVYVRLHGHTRTYASAYSNTLLDEWADKIRSWNKQGKDAYVYFDNDSEGAAPYDALELMERVGLR
ncbi:MAG: DUF72 domain-containing protein [Persicimonas sp.]